MKSKFNSQCDCGSGKKYKDCSCFRRSHSGAPPQFTLQQRNLILLNAAHNIFGFKRGRTWQDFKKRISGEEIREFFSVQALLYQPQTEWRSILPPPDSTLRGL